MKAIRPDNDSIAAVLHQPPDFASRSGLFPLVEALGAKPIFYNEYWRRVQRRSWTLGVLARRFGSWYYGSEWNSLMPIWGEACLRRQLPEGCTIAHFLWGEFASPKRRNPIHAKARAVVGTFHASAARLPRVLARFNAYDVYDRITLMSESQRPYFESHGVAGDRISVILHGVDTTYYSPALRPRREPGQPLRGLLVGSTERDHAFLAALLRAIPGGILQMTILTAYDQRILNYQNVPHTIFPEFMADSQLRSHYQQADLLIMPMMDCTANNAILESMACGTPVLTNRVGGIPEYVDPACNKVMDRKNIQEWIEVLVDFAIHREKLEAMRDAARASVLRLDWSLVAPHYLAVYKSLLGNHDD